MPGHVISSTPAACEAHHVVSDDLWVQIMTDDDPYNWHRQEQTAVWQMPPATRLGWVMSRDFPLRACRNCHSSAVAVGLVLICTLVGLTRCGQCTSWRASCSHWWLTSSSMCSSSDKLMQSWSAAVEVPQTQFFDAVGLQSWACGCALTSVYVPVVRQRQVQGASEGVEEFHTFPTHSLALHPHKKIWTPPPRPSLAGLFCAMHGSTVVTCSRTVSGGFWTYFHYFFLRAGFTRIFRSILGSTV